MRINHIADQTTVDEELEVRAFHFYLQRIGLVQTAADRAVQRRGNHIYRSLTQPGNIDERPLAVSVYRKKIIVPSWHAAQCDAIEELTRSAELLDSDLDIVIGLGADGHITD